jgi:hypothetical protein
MRLHLEPLIDDFVEQLLDLLAQATLEELTDRPGQSSERAPLLVTLAAGPGPLVKTAAPTRRREASPKPVSSRNAKELSPSPERPSKVGAGQAKSTTGHAASKRSKRSLESGARKRPQKVAASPPMQAARATAAAGPRAHAKTGAPARRRKARPKSASPTSAHGSKALAGAARGKSTTRGAVRKRPLESGARKRPQKVAASPPMQAARATAAAGPRSHAKIVAPARRRKARPKSASPTSARGSKALAGAARGKSTTRGALHKRPLESGARKRPQKAAASPATPPLDAGGTPAPAA